MQNDSELALKVSNLSKIYANGLTAVKGVSLTVKHGDFLALLGPNGAGKSTTIGMISTLITKTRGKIEIFGRDLDQQFSLAKQYLGIMPQEINLNIFETPKQILRYQANYYGLSYRETKKRLESLLNTAGLWHKRDTPVRMLSGGMKRRLMIARALIHQPQLLILDEPTAGVDIEIRQTIWEFLQTLNAQGLTIILTTHYLEEAEKLCDHIAIINFGEIMVQTSMKQLLDSLAVEQVVLNLKHPIEKLRPLKGVNAKLIQPDIIELVLPKCEAIADVLLQLHQAGVVVNRIHHKQNRLEQMFLQLVETNQQTARVNP